MDLKPYLHVDASAAIGIAQRKGLGKIRHLDTQSLWIQDALRERRLALHKVPGTCNPADMMTKALDAKQMLKLMAMLNLKVLSGRASAAPELTKYQQEGDIEAMEIYNRELDEGQLGGALRGGARRGGYRV